MKKNEHCIICNSKDFLPLFSKPSAYGDKFTLIRCKNCGLKFLSEVPAEEETVKYYEKEYFTKRTERGYDNYFSNSVKTEIERVFKLNLSDLGFFKFEDGLKKPGRSLDIGCAAGYFVNYMKKRGWHSSGIDVSKICAEFAVRSGLDVMRGDYLDTEFHEKFDLITLWATIEHLNRPDLVLRKINSDLKNDGMLFISTCRIDGLNFMKLFGEKWRYYNFPEHVYFFSYRTVTKILSNSGFKMINYKTYGSNIGKGGTLLRKVADTAAKRLYLGDMMIISAKKIS